MPPPCVCRMGPLDWPVARLWRRCFDNVELFECFPSICIAGVTCKSLQIYTYGVCVYAVCVAMHVHR